MSCKKGANWTEGETRTFLELVTEKSILSIMDGKKHRHIEIFRMLVPEMQTRGYDKTAEQMKLKLKNLRTAYMKCKRDNNVSGAAPSTCPFYNELDVLYGSRPCALGSSSNQVGIDTAEINNKEDIEEDDEICTLDVEEGDEILNEDEENKAPPAKKKKQTKTGRRSYEIMLQSHNDKWLENQKDLFNSIANKQIEFQK
ncbi:PREDICTED: zinc finger and SCAN domain-containing protein 29-like [Wasmannia auropunctata]|uniref:zinc finger and SCAN domain-containing protein 29-like n=1 Tax=Wasmannia auropunctata TaxID=64793 RepID=UPI0005EE0A31|nr:PREDICTED: zinc finger and SCAN domain-containing protein 29-like [Wasmannia auropunctata]